MSKNPYINALSVALYIVFVVLLITYGPAHVRDKPDTMPRADGDALPARLFGFSYGLPLFLPARSDVS